MTLQSLRPILRTWDFEGTIAFYASVLGFECVSRSDEWKWALLTSDQIGIMISGPNDHENDTEPRFTGSLSITCNNVNEIWDSVQGKAKVCYPIENFPYDMREFGIYDNNRYVVTFGTPTSAETPPSKDGLNE